MKKLSYKVALGGVIASVCVFIMFLTGFGPFLTYLCPMCAGALLTILVVEVSRKWALATYSAVSILTIFMTPDKEAALFFIFIFGHYPILKSLLEKIPSRILEWAAKLAVFNIGSVSVYLLIIHVFGMTQFLDAFGEWGQYGVQIFLLIANVVFVMYDYTISNLIDTYIKWFRPKFLRKFK